MIRNYFTVAFRNLLRNKQFSLINILGLALGIGVFLFIMQFVAFEWSTNRFSKNFDRLYRVNVQSKKGDAVYNVPPGYAPILKQQVPAIENYVRIADGIASGVVTYAAPTPIKDRTFREEQMIYVDGSFLQAFSFPLVAGTPTFSEPNTLALSETTSKKLFGTDNAIGKVLMVSNQFGNTPYTVRAVYKQPAASDVKAEILLSLQTLESKAARGGNDWADPSGLESGFVNIFLLLQKGADAKLVGSNITNLVKKANPGANDDTITLQPLSELHLAPSFSYPLQTYGSLLQVVVFFCVAVLILLIAWVNYINLSTAQATNRAKEVGVRKVLGASRSQLVVQYLAETFLLTLASVVVALVLVTLLQPYFNDFTGRQLALSVLNSGWFWIAGISLLLAGSLLSGSYVAFVLTAYKPISVMKGSVQSSVKGFSMRKGLVVFQFTISIVFIIATIILYNQLQYMKTEKLGMDLDQLVVIQGPTVTSEGQAARNVSFKNALGQLPFVKKYAASNNIPGQGYNFSAGGITSLSPQNGDDKKSYSMFICDERFFDTYGIQFAQGQTFSRNDAESSWNNVRKVIINEKAARELGFNTTENIIGKKIKWGETFEVIGVVKDYHHLSLREAIKPTIYLGSVSYGYFTLQTDTRDMGNKISAIKKLYSSTFPGNPFEYIFADERYDRQYASEQKLGNVFIAAACIAILIACLGLYGLAAFTARQRTKEIGIRKVLGASITSITTLLSKDFIILVIISIVIASPIAWWAMHSWLQDFAYQASISWWIFIVAGTMAIAIAWSTISFQAIKAARANPVKSLRSE